jgi:hypothetical protein
VAAVAPVVVALLKVALPVAGVLVALAVVKYRELQLVLQAKVMLVEMVHGLRHFSSLVMLEGVAAVLAPLVAMAPVFIILLPEVVMGVVASLLLFLRHHIVILAAAVAAHMVAPAQIWSEVGLAQQLSAVAQAAREVARMPEILAL